MASENNRYSDSAIDGILSELQQKGGDAPAYSDDMLDSILAELGTGAAAPAPAAPPQPPREEKPARPAKKQPAAASAPAPPPEEEKPARRTAAVAEAPPEASRRARPEKGEHTPSIMDVKVAHSDEPARPRTGKAAAMGKVKPGKFSNDPEFMKWQGIAPLPDDDDFIEDDGDPAYEEMPAVSPAYEENYSPAKAYGGEAGFYEDPPAPATGEPDESLFHTWRGQARSDSPPPFLPGPPEYGLPEEPAEEPSPPGPPDESLFHTWRGPAHPDAPAHPATQRAAESEAALPGETETRIYETDPQTGEPRVPTAAFTQRFDPATGKKIGPISEADRDGRYLDGRANDEKFRNFFQEHANSEEPEPPPARGRKKRRSSTGEFKQLDDKVKQIEDARDIGDEDEDEYNHLRDAEAIQDAIAGLRTSLYQRAAITGGLALAALWLTLGYAGLPVLPGFMMPAAGSLIAAFLYLTLIIAAAAVNYKTLLAGLGGLFGDATIESPAAIGLLAAVFQAAVLPIQAALQKPLGGALFGVPVLVIAAAHSIGKALQTGAIFRNFQFTSSGRNYAAAYVLSQSHDLAHSITAGLEETDPALLLSRQTELMKGFMRQSFSQSMGDRYAKPVAWLLLAVSTLLGIVVGFSGQSLFSGVTAVAAVCSFAIPLSSSLSAALPAVLLEKNASRAGAVVPGCSAMAELGGVNVVMCESGDLFPPEAVQVSKITMYQTDNLEYSIRYAASVLTEGCDTLREAFLAMVDNKPESLYPIESLECEPGRGFIAYINHHRVVIGSREMLQRHCVVTLPPVTEEMSLLPPESVPLYLVVSDRLHAMFAIEYRPDVEVDEVLGGLVKNGTSLLVTSYDVNVNAAMIEEIYRLPQGMVKVLGRRELIQLEPLTRFLPKSEGVMAHLGGFGSLIGGMRAAAGASAAERMACLLQGGAVLLAFILCTLLAFSGTLPALSLLPVLLYQLAWSVMVAGVPFTRNYG